MKTNESGIPIVVADIFHAHLSLSTKHLTVSFQTAVEEELDMSEDLLLLLDHQNIFKNAQDNIDLVSKQIRDGETKREDNSEFNKEAYWSQMGAIFKVLSTETTKLSLAFSKKPFPSYKNTEQMSQELEKRMLQLVSAYYSLPKSQGECLRAHLSDAVLQILDSMRGFVTAVLVCLKPDGRDKRLQWTGGVWEAADFVLMKDNQTCVLRDLKVTTGLVDDALSEIEQASENDGQAEDFMFTEDDVSSYDEDHWSVQDREVVQAATGLVKTAKTIIKKCKDSVNKNGKEDSHGTIRTLDELVQLVCGRGGEGQGAGVSCRVDDFVIGVYAPVNFSQLEQSGKSLFELNGKILKLLRDSCLTCDDDSKWIDFLGQANAHNLTKLSEAVLPRAMEAMCVQ